MKLLALLGLAMPWLAGRVLSGAAPSTVEWWGENALVVAGVFLLYMIWLGIMFSRAFASKWAGLLLGLGPLIVLAAGHWVWLWDASQFYIVLASTLGSRLVRLVSTHIESSVVVVVSYVIISLAFLVGFATGRRSPSRGYVGEYRLP